MRTRTSAGILMLEICCLLLLAPMGLWAAQSYTVQDLNIDDAIKAVGPNASGQVAVRSGFLSARSFRSKPGAPIENLGVLSRTDHSTVNVLGLQPSGDHTTAHAINDAGIVVASTNTSFGSRPCRPDIPGLPPAGTCPISAVRAAIWTSAGGLVDLGALPGDSTSEAFGINNPGAVVGYSSGSKGARAFLWTVRNGMQNLGTLPGGDFSKAFGISDNGLVVGISGTARGTRAVLWGSSGIQDLGTLPGDTSSAAFAVSVQGSVVGYSVGPTGTRAFLWTSKNGMQSLAGLPGASVTRALGINERDEVVGSSGSGTETRAVLWAAKGEAQDLNAHVFLPSGVSLLSAVGINAKGQVLALGSDHKDPHGFHEGTNRVFLLHP